jgi:hypothetical protein
MYSYNIPSTFKDDEKNANKNECLKSPSKNQVLLEKRGKSSLNNKISSIAAVVHEVSLDS